MRNKSNENWEVGQQCLQSGHLNVAASRLYYAVFQAVLAWARAKKAYDGTEHGVHAAMCRYVRAEGKARKLYGRIFTHMRELRETADYQPDTPARGELNELLGNCEEMRVYYLRKAGI